MRIDRHRVGGFLWVLLSTACFSIGPTLIKVRLAAAVDLVTLIVVRLAVVTAAFGIVFPLPFDAGRTTP